MVPRTVLGHPRHSLDSVHRLLAPREKLDNTEKSDQFRGLTQGVLGQRFAQYAEAGFESPPDTADQHIQVGFSLHTPRKPVSDTGWRFVVPWLMLSTRKGVTSRFVTA